MKRIAILIATTGGPVLVDRITPEPAPQSMMCLRRQSEVLPISLDYDDFVRAGSGVIMREFGPYEEGAFRLDVSGPIGTGLSWQLGVFAAHAVFKSKSCELSDLETADLIVWLSGTVDNDLNVGDVDHMAQKVEASAGMLADYIAKGTPIVFGAGVENAVFLSAHKPPGGIDVASLKTTHDLMEVLGLGTKDKERGNATFWVMAGAALLALAVVFVWSGIFSQEGAKPVIETNVPETQPQLTIDIFSDRGQHPTYAFGEDLNLQVRLSRKAWLLCDYEQVDGKVIRIYPNDQVRDVQAFDADIDHILSASQNAPFRIRLGPPAGQETVICYASEDPLQGEGHPLNAALDRMNVTLKP
ncbi:MAG: DUF4384 domain-containing protein [Terasakiella sp.]|uniref:DUF4384 domain-containing protein n=1 Tax=unclassified Terasakiella TaxID=2614952 RepID=UPI003AFFA7E5